MSGEPASSVDRIGRRIVVVVIVLALLPAVLMALQLRVMTRGALAPEMHAKAAAVAQSAARQIDHAVSLGIPLGELVGMGEFLAGLRDADRDVGYIAVTTAPGPLYAAGPVPDGLAHASGPDTTVVGEWYDTRVATADGAHVHVGIARALVDRELDAMLFDLLIVFVASTLIGFEILLFVMARHLLAPIALVRAVVADGCQGRFGQLIAIAGSDPLGRLAMALNRAVRRLSLRQARLAAIAADLGERAGGLLREAVESTGRRLNPGGGEAVWKTVPLGMTVVRAPVFLFVLAEEMSRSFLPIFARDLVPEGAAELESMAISLPLSVYMAAFLGASLLAGPLIERLGPRAVFRRGAVLGCAAFAATAMAATLWDFVLWRALAGTGYGLMFIAAQTEVVDNSPPDRRSQNISILIGAIFAAAICGASIGGVLAERAGFRATFVLSAVLTAAAALTASGVMSRDLPETRDRPPFWTLIGIFRNRRFLALALLASIPAKLVLAGFLFYLVPLILAAEHDPAAIGRMIMVYPLLMVAGVPLFGRYAGPARNFALVAAGGLVVGLGVASLWWNDGILAVLVAVAALGLGQSLSNSAQVALVSEYCAEECRRYGNAAVLGVFRLTERAGSIIGPLLAAVAAGPLGYDRAAAVLGLLVAASTLLLGVLVLSGRGDGRRELD